MRKISSAPCFGQIRDKIQVQKTKFASKILIKSYDKNIKKAHIASAVFSSLAIGYYNWIHDDYIKFIGNATFTLCCGYSVMMTFAKDYSTILQQWREEEANYEEKTDPPEWDWQIINLFEHISTYLWFASALCSDIHCLEYLAQYIQVMH